MSGKYKIERRVISQVDTKHWDLDWCTCYVWCHKQLWLVVYTLGDHEVSTDAVIHTDQYSTNALTLTPSTDHN